FFFLLINAAAVYPEQEVRGLWVVRDSLTSPVKIQELVSYADSIRCNVLFVQVMGRGDAFYQSKIAPGPEEYSQIPAVFDPLAMVIELAHKRGIEVHAWLNMCLVWSSPRPPASAAHVLNCHPGWFMIGRDNVSMAECPLNTLLNRSIEGRYLSPSLPEVRKHLTRMAEEVVRKYPVDGIHLDYIRYPGLNYDFREEVIRDFRKQFGIDPRRLFSGGAEVDRDLSLLGKWTNYRAEAVTGLVREISFCVRGIDENVRVSAAVKPDAQDAAVTYGQDWAEWVNTGIVDFVVTMSYFSPGTPFRETPAFSLNAVDPRKVVGGIGVFQLSSESVSEQLAANRRQGLLGNCLFSYGSLRENPKQGALLIKKFAGGKNELPPEFKPYLRKKK
ncbi:MAG: family 10 glycosylhydrolase, partial [Candidatus Latescibacterota bacterium]